MFSYNLKEIQLHSKGIIKTSIKNATETQSCSVLDGQVRQKNWDRLNAQPIRYKQTYGISHIFLVFVGKTVFRV